MAGLISMLCRPLPRARIWLLTSNLGFRCAPPQALCCGLLRRLVTVILSMLNSGCSRGILEPWACRCLSSMTRNHYRPSIAADGEEGSRRIQWDKLERATGLEPATLSLG